MFMFAKIFSATYTVTTTSDSGTGSLREAIASANASPGSDNIYFSIPVTDQGYNAATGVFTIRLTSSLPMIQGGYINIDASSQETNQGNTNPFGPEIRITPNGSISYPFILVSPGNTIRGFIISGFEYGILIYNSTSFNNIVTENYIGTNYDATVSEPNQYGIGIGSNAYGNMITNNVISGNTQAGVAITESGNNTLKGNAIGVDIYGMTAVPNLYGIAIQNASYNQIGGASLQEKNVISGNSFAGIIIDGLQSTYNTIEGNHIGVSSGGCFRLSNQNGIVLSNASYTTVGGGFEGQQNIISGNTDAGIILNGSGTRMNTIQGNRIGTNIDGTLPISNYAGVVLKSNSNNNLIGGSQTGEGNVISANTEMGIYVEASDSNVIIGNLVGTNIFGTEALTINDSLVQANGVEFNTVAKYNRLGGYTPAERNIISGNRVYGMVYYGNTSYNPVIGNYIGTDITGNYSIPNATGICVDGGSHHNPIINNVLSGNKSYGIFIVTNQTFFNEVRGNKIGTNASGTDTIPNDAGVLLGGGARYNTIGGYNTDDRNIISGNRYGGIEISDQFTEENRIAGNYIGTNVTGMYALPNQYGIGLTTRPKANIIDNNLISGNKEFGMLLFEFADSNVITRNTIGTSADQAQPLGNGTAGIIIWGGSSGNRIGGQGEGNIIAFHDSLGVFVKDTHTKFNTFSENSMYQNNHMGIDLAPEGPNFNDSGDTDDGPNGLMNHPVIQHASTDPSSGYFWAYGIIDTQQPEGTAIEIFISDGNTYDRGEGKTFLGRTTASSAGEWMFYLQGAETGDLLTATATDIQGNTSEFSPNFMVITGIGNSEQNQVVRVYPNPASDVVYIETEIPVTSLKLIDMKGAEIFCNIVRTDECKFSILIQPDLAEGNYCLQIQCGEKKLGHIIHVLR